jgi:uncharacterized damage-inducible protein DinB
MTERNNYIGKIQQLPQNLEDAISKLSDSQLDKPVGEGKWTIRQIVHHIADANMNAYTRMKLIVTEEKPILKPYNQDRWAALADGKDARIESTLNLIKGLHERWIHFLHSIPEASWTNEGIHLENGKVTLDDVLRTYSIHGETHIQQIVKFREKMNW